MRRIILLAITATALFGFTYSPAQAGLCVEAHIQINDQVQDVNECSPEAPALPETPALP